MSTWCIPVCHMAVLCKHGWMHGGLLSTVLILRVVHTHKRSLSKFRWMLSIFRQHRMHEIVCCYQCAVSENPSVCCHEWPCMLKPTSDCFTVRSQLVQRSLNYFGHLFLITDRMAEPSMVWCWSNFKPSFVCHICEPKLNGALDYFLFQTVKKEHVCHNHIGRTSRRVLETYNK